MAFPLLGLAAGAAGGAALRYGPHIFRYFYPRVVPKMVTGAKGLGQLMKPSPKNPLVIGGAIGSILDNINEAHAPSNPYLQNMQQPYGPFMPSTAPRTEMPLGVGNHPPLPNAQEATPQELKPYINEQIQPQTQPLATASQAPPPEPTDLDKFLQSNTYKFFQSDAYKKLQDLFAGMSAAPSGGSGWDALASGVKHLNEGDKQRGQVNQTVEYLKSKGYSEEEAAVMARNPQMLSALLTGGTDSIKHYNDGSSLIDDPTSPTGKRVVYHPGGKAYLDNERAAALRQHKNVYAKVLLDDIDYVQEYLEKFKDKATGNIALVASYASPTSEQSDARQILESIQSRIALDRIDQMKLLSQRGALGLGNVSDKDIEMLKESLGKLSLRMSTRELKRRLSTIKDVLSRLNPEVQGIVLGKIEATEDNMRNAVTAENGQYSTDYLMLPEKYAGVSVITTNEAVQNLPKGSKFAFHTQDGIRIYER
ncbi:hypothetical protein [Bartonella grahamii]|uniref:hypothetical protein n=1 Tax=Bartonella grahamii TaxID=33045 RepID=UPI002E7B0569|nr:hypothetical protein [Bartonella grahamii]